MGRPTEPLLEPLPAITVEAIGVRSPADAGRSWTATIDRRPPGSLLYERAAGWARRTRRRYDIAIRAHRGCDPRRQSVVEHRLPQPAAEVMGALCGDEAIRLATPALTLTGDLRSTAYDSLDHEYRLPTDMHLAWSWPDLPMWLAVGEVSSTTCALRLSLRTRRRFRYPARYFDAAHTALTTLASRLDLAR